MGAYFLFIISLGVFFINRGLTHLLVAFIGLAIIFIGIFYSYLNVPSIFISCATLSALFFTAIDFASLLDEEDKVEINKKDNFYQKTIIFTLNNLIKYKENFIIVCLVFAIFSIIFIPYIPNFDSFLNSNINNMITLISLGFVILIISFRQVKSEAQYEKELKSVIEEMKDIISDYQDMSKESKEGLEDIRDEYEKMLKSNKEIHKQLEEMINKYMAEK